MRRGLLLAGLILAATLHAAPRKANLAPVSRSWIAKKAGEGIWCRFASEAAAKAAIASEAFDAENRAIVLRSRGRIVAIEVSNDDDDGSYADDVYRLDPAMRLVRMERTGRGGDEPAFTLTYAPDSGGDLMLTAPSKALLERLDDQDRDTGISDWARYRGVDRMPFRALIGPAAAQAGCARAAP